MSDLISIGAGWTEIANRSVLAQALELAGSDYQRDVLRGLESLSGSTLSSAVRARHRRTYYRARQNLLMRLRENAIPFHERVGNRGKRILVLGQGGSQ